VSATAVMVAAFALTVHFWPMKAHDSIGFSFDTRLVTHTRPTAPLALPPAAPPLPAASVVNAPAKPATTPVVPPRQIAVAPTRSAASTPVAIVTSVPTRPPVAVSKDSGAKPSPGPGPIATGQVSYQPFSSGTVVAVPRQQIITPAVRPTYPPPQTAPDPGLFTPAQSFPTPFRPVMKKSPPVAR
jgi:hypothetical protein